MATVLGKLDCPALCGDQAEVREAKAGGLTTYCPGCKYQGFAKTPKAATALRARFSAAPAAAPARGAAAAAAPGDFASTVFGKK